MTYKNALDKSKYYFNKAIQIDNHLDSHLYLGKISEMEDRPKDAITFYRYRVKNRINNQDEYFKEASKGIRNIFKNDSNLFKEYLLKEGYAH